MIADVIPQIFVAIGFIVILVNIITEVFKKVMVFKSEKEINRFVVFISQLLTFAFFVLYWKLNDLIITWYMSVSFIIIGFLVAYAAMFGFDKLLKYFEGYLKR